jgi:hypothetical protein
LDGDIKLWDIRSHNDLPVQTWVPYASGLSSFAGHPQAPVFAAQVDHVVDIAILLTIIFL